MLVILQTLKSGKRRQHHVKDEDSMADSKLQCWFVSLALQKAKQSWATYKEFAMGKKKQHSRKEGQILRRKYCSVAVDNKANSYLAHISASHFKLKDAAKTQKQKQQTKVGTCFVWMCYVFLLFQMKYAPHASPYAENQCLVNECLPEHWKIKHRQERKSKLLVKSSAFFNCWWNSKIARTSRNCMIFSMQYPMEQQFFRNCSGYDSFAALGDSSWKSWVLLSCD